LSGRLFVLELESLAIAENQQRKGVGTLDENREKSYLRASKEGKGLYEKFGWKQVGIFRPDLSEFGWAEEYETYYMVRDPVL